MSRGNFVKVLFHAVIRNEQAIMGHSPGDVGEGYIHPPLHELYDVLIAAESEMLKRAA